MSKKILWMSMSLLCLILAGCNAAKNKEEPADKSIYMDPEKLVQERVESLMSQMTVEEKIGQMLQAEQSESRGGASPEDAKTHLIGSMLFSGGAQPESGIEVLDWKERAELYEAKALETRLGIPLLYGIDAIHGNNNVYGATIFPHSIGLGAADNLELTKEIGRISAIEIRASGIHMTFAPTLGLPINDRWGRFYECFSESAELTGRLGAAYIEGFQGQAGSDEFLAGDRVISTAKHYLGEGLTKDGKNQGNVEMSPDEFNKALYEELIIPYQDAVDAGVKSIMVSYHSINGLGVHANKELITGVLKEELAFDGIVVSDYNAITKLLTPDDSYKDKLALAVNAGIDLFMEPHNWLEFLQTMKALVDDGTVPMERIDDAVARILTAKFEMGLFEQPFCDDALVEQVGIEAHREVSRQAVRESLTLLKNDFPGGGEQNALDLLLEADNILVAGIAADDIGIQCGGWSITWQGNIGETTVGTTILEGIREVAGDDKKIVYSGDGNTSEKVEAAIIVVGERPYSESKGDRQPGELVLNDEDRAVIENVRMNNADIPIICVLITGRPLTLTGQLDDLDALVCAWLPGTEGAGVADVLFGGYEFTGTTPVTWPWYALDVNEKFTDSSKVLFPFGTGLKKDGTAVIEGSQTTIGEPPSEPFDDTIIRFDDNGGTFEAEDTYGQFETVIEYKEGASLGACLGGIYGASEARYMIEFTKAGTYRIDMKIAAGRSDIKTGMLKFSWDGSDEKLQPELKYTGGWGEREKDWKIVSFECYFTAGQNMIKVEADDWGFNLDQFTFTLIEE